VAQYSFTAPSDLNREALGTIDLTGSAFGDDKVVRRLTSVSGSTVTVTLAAADGTLSQAAAGGNLRP
jgi:hypothetical protein